MDDERVGARKEDPRSVLSHLDISFLKGHYLSVRPQKAPTLFEVIDPNGLVSQSRLLIARWVLRNSGIPMDDNSRYAS